MRACKNARADGEKIIHGGRYKRARAACVGAYNDTADSMTEKEKQNRHATGWSNQFAMPWEVSSYWAFTTRYQFQLEIFLVASFKPFKFSLNL